MLIEALKCFPAIVAIGREQLQGLADEWSRTATARECSILRVIITEELSIGFSLQLSHNLENGEIYHFPTDDLLHYLANNGIPDRNARDAAIRDIDARRSLVGPSVYQRFRLRTKSLYLTCKNPTCGNVMKYNVPIDHEYSGIEIDGQCPRCETVFTYTENDFRLTP